jgi:hypothetical protein
VITATFPVMSNKLMFLSQIVCLFKYRHSGAMRSIEPGISRFRVWCCAPSPE